MKFEQMKVGYQERYNNETQRDSESDALLALFDKAELLSDDGKVEFVKAFDFEIALEGYLYLGGKRSAAITYPYLTAECAALGIRTVTR